MMFVGNSVLVMEPVLDSDKFSLLAANAAENGYPDFRIIHEILGNGVHKFYWVSDAIHRQKT